jgi:hypothetical protein
MQLPKFLLHILTESDNSTFCPVRLIALLGSFQYMGMGIANYVQHAAFDPQGYAIGFGALLGGVGVALGLKKDHNGGEGQGVPK